MSPSTHHLCLRLGIYKKNNNKQCTIRTPAFLLGTNQGLIKTLFYNDLYQGKYKREGLDIIVI